MIDVNTEDLDAVPAILLDLDYTRTLTDGTIARCMKCRVVVVPVGARHSASDEDRLRAAVQHRQHCTG